MDLYAGCAKGGQIVVPIMFRLAAPEIEYIINHSASKAFVVEKPFVDIINSIRGKLDIPDDRMTFLFGRDSMYWGKTKQDIDNGFFGHIDYWHYKTLEKLFNGCSLNTIAIYGYNNHFYSKDSRTRILSMISDILLYFNRNFSNTIFYVFQKKMFLYIFFVSLLSRFDRNCRYYKGILWRSKFLWSNCINYSKPN